MGTSRLTEERVDIIYKVDLSRIKTINKFYLTLSAANKDILTCVCMWTKGKSLVYDMHFIKSPKSRFSLGHRIPWTGPVAAGGGNLQEECSFAKERGAPGKAGEWGGEIGLARGGVQRARGCLRPQGPAGGARRALAHRSVLSRCDKSRQEGQKLLAVRLEAALAGESTLRSSSKPSSIFQNMLV